LDIALVLLSTRNPAYRRTQRRNKLLAKNG
jgi:hypothetical protein